MKLEVNSRVILDITRAKAKLYEFGIEEQFHLDMAQDPRRLVLLTIGILGELSAAEARSPGSVDSYKQELQEQLVLVGQYFESLTTSKITSGIDEYLTILSSAAYYLADMPGSSLVVARLLPPNPAILTDSYLEGYLVWLLKQGHDESYYEVGSGVFNTFVSVLHACFSSFFQLGSDIEAVLDAAAQLRKAVYERGSDREILLVDTICAVVSRRLHTSSIICLPQYTGIDIDEWAPILKEGKTVREFWPGQRLIAEAGVLNGKSAVIQMPTSAGKTKSAEIVIRSAFMNGRANLAVVVAPFRALCSEIKNEFEKSFANERVGVNELRDVSYIDTHEAEFLKFLLGDEYKGSVENNILISTPEKLVYLLRQKPELAKKIGLVIFDEGHQFDTGTRGVTYELLISSLNVALPADAQKLLISAVVSNAESLNDWLNGESGIFIQTGKKLPAIKSVAFLSWVTDMGQLSYLDSDNVKDSGLYVPRVIQETKLNRKKGERKDRYFPERSKSASCACYLGIRLASQGPVAMFCGTKATVKSTLKLIVGNYERGLSLAPPSTISDSGELLRIAKLMNMHFGDGNIYSKAIELGALPHSTGIPNGVRVSVEWAMSHNQARLVVCTSTLAQGVNLPIKYLIISSLAQGKKWIKTRDFQNLIGRAGRAGYHTEGSIIFSDQKIYDGRRTLAGRKRWADVLGLLDFSNSEDCISSLLELVKPFDPLSEVNTSLQFLKDPSEAIQNLKKSFGPEEARKLPLYADMVYRASLVESIESFFLAMIRENPATAELSSFVELCHGTLAYHLSGPQQKAHLDAAFLIFHDRISALPAEKFSYYGKTLLGLDALKRIDNWLIDNSFELDLQDDAVEMLTLFWDLLEDVIGDRMSRIEPREARFTIADMWVRGDSYDDIYKKMVKMGAVIRAGSMLRKVTQEAVVDFTAMLAFDGMSVIGASADILEETTENETAYNLVRRLQESLRLGLKSDFEVWLYGKGYTDREVCKVLNDSLKDVRKENIVNLNILSENIDLVREALKDLPSAYSQITEPSPL
ncbi:DEAD/DEAH box helicase [Pseudomonas sp. s4]|uniref:DEAD/DEAH box helicase n=1 Tax=Pseudomonas TaxID=286 RepID=UPI00209BB78C|nr:DEAD/DEAH box helicase [Pseudomonas asiatica]MCO7535191.1 DEAD/DEAH box helicase [Pseudomonas asiatica]MCO7548654.1 DEAD/DEAH box helicase [Pseudomonas asiatica]MCO7562448.1 DEAD/DEAH box helicase [Pseudomonas asiatica]